MTRLLALISVLAGGLLFAAASSRACDCDKTAPLAATAPAETPPAAPAGHPLKGIVVGIFPEKLSLLVKHEEIPGVMKAMTMLLKVDAQTLAAAKKDQAITGTLVQKPDGWWLQDVKIAEAVK